MKGRDSRLYPGAGPAENRFQLGADLISKAMQPCLGRKILIISSLARTGIKTGRLPGGSQNGQGILNHVGFEHHLQEHFAGIIKRLPQRPESLMKKVDFPIWHIPAMIATGFSPKA